MLPVNEIFETIQGEGTWTGSPAVFIRLQGCDVGCPWCDTKHTWSKNASSQVSAASMLGKTEPSATYALLPVSIIVELVAGFRAKHVVITGGEPCIHDLTKLTSQLILNGCFVQIETSGTYPVLAWPGTWVTVSPKVGMPGGREVLASAVQRADEIKMPVGRPCDIERLEEILALRALDPAVWLQPLSLSEKATALCVEASTVKGWRVSLQTHKFAGIR